MSKLESLYVRRDRLVGGLQGLLIGDALGVPYEFHDPLNLPPMAQIDMEPPPSFARAHAGVPPGTWSDDGAQALCLLASLMACQGLDLGDFSRRLMNWAHWGYLAVDGKVFDIGLQTGQAIHRLDTGVPPEEAGPRGEFDNGNGSLMRVLPLALWHRESDLSLIAMAARQSLPTHGHPRAAVACAMLCLWARAELHALASSWDWAASRLRECGPRAGLAIDEIDVVLAPRHRDNVSGSGYVVDTLWSARVALETAHDYASTVRRAIGFGNDTDTTAAVAGGLAGIRYGLYGIPLAWREALRGQALLHDLQQALILRATDGEPVRRDKVRTSVSHPLYIGTLALDSGGKIGITFCPGKKQPYSETGSWDRDLDVDLAAIKDWGATHLVTLIAPWEFAELGVEALPERARAHGLTWYHAPILDGHIPGMVPKGFDPTEWFDTVWPAILPHLHAALGRGEGVVVHCKGGLGRAGMAAALLLVAHQGSLDVEEVIDRVRAARPNAIETVIQEDYLRALLSDRSVMVE
jgi:ADP-ribosylglycohydrolase/protein-tyrosine phosphatase